MKTMTVIQAVGLVVSLACGVPDGETATTPTLDSAADAPGDPGDGALGEADSDGDGSVTVPSTPPPPPQSEGEERPAVMMRAFECASAAVGERMVVGRIETSGATLAITPAGSDCQFDLWHEGATMQRLSTAPAGYLVVAASSTGGTDVVCASAVTHSAAGAFRRVDSVSIECARVGEGTLEPVIVPDGEYAAWVREVQLDGAGVTVRWARDFSFQFLNLTDAGRPPEDGVYETRVPWSSFPGGGVTTKLSDRQNPLASVEATPWDPTPSERGQHAGLIDFSDGPCPEGCPTSAQ